jgi:GT2 family glycosyltransferase
MVRDIHPTTTLIESGGNLGFSAANNLALQQATGSAVLLLNPDTVCPPASLARLFRFLNGKPDAAVVGPRLVDGESRPTISGGDFPGPRHHWNAFFDARNASGRDRRTFTPARDQHSRPVDYVMGACFLMSRRGLDALGSLDERFFMYFEETDWCRRAHDAGLEVWYCAETEITHLEGQAAEQASRFSTLQFQKSYRLYMAKHHGRGGVWAVRLAQAAEYGLKSLLRRMAPGDKTRNRALAEVYGRRARLQLKSRLEVAPPV